jgi:hypothetical protein
MNGPDILALKNVFVTANSNAEWSILVVVIGLIIEFAVLLVFSKEMSHTEKWLLVIANIFVAGGVGGEYIFGGRASDAATQLQQASDSQIEQLRYANLKLEAQIAPRDLSPEDMLRIADVLTPFRGRKLTIRPYVSDAEGFRLVVLINRALAGTGVISIPGLLYPEAEQLLLGVEVLGPESEREFVAALEKALGPSAIGLRSHRNPTAPGTDVELHVGVKPFPIP